MTLTPKDLVAAVLTASAVFVFFPTHEAGTSGSSATATAGPRRRSSAFGVLACGQGSPGNGPATRLLAAPGYAPTRGTRCSRARARSGCDRHGLLDGTVSTISTGGWSGSSSRLSTTRSVLRPSEIVSPGRMFGTAIVSCAGSAGRPSAVSSLNRNDTQSSHPGPDGAASLVLRREM
jgi:hypothetical protein